MANGQWVGEVQSGQLADGLLLYQPNAGQANVVSFDAVGKVRLQAANDWGNSWDLIVPGYFLGNQQAPQAPPAPPIMSRQPPWSRFFPVHRR
jgi:hypothetical protein